MIELLFIMDMFKLLLLIILLIIIFIIYNFIVIFDLELNNVGY